MALLNTTTRSKPTEIGSNTTTRKTIQDYLETLVAVACESSNRRKCRPTQRRRRRKPQHSAHGEPRGSGALAGATSAHADMEHSVEEGRRLSPVLEPEPGFLWVRLNFEKFATETNKTK